MINGIFHSDLLELRDGGEVKGVDSTVITRKQWGIPYKRVKYLLYVKEGKKSKRRSNK